MTILGQHSVTELKDLLKAKDANLADMSKAFSSFGPAWKSQDPSSYSSWSSDFNLFKSGYSLASIEAKAEILGGEMTPFVSDDNIPAESGYQAVLSSLQKTPGVVSAGDFQDLFNRLQAAQKQAGQTPYKESPTPQPTKGSDTDLNTMNAATGVLNSLPTVVPTTPSAAKRDVGILLGLAGVGLVGFALVQVNTFTSMFRHSSR
jgi:hypothetical protein